jgi:cell division septal protein FtsQ
LSATRTGAADRYRMKLITNSRSRRKSNRRSKPHRRRNSHTYATAVPLTQRMGGLLRGRSSSHSASARPLSGVASVGSRALALLLALSMTGVLVWFFVDFRFFIYALDVKGADLVSTEDVYLATGLHELSVFYVNRAKAADRVRDSLIAVESANVSCTLPARVQITVQEKMVAYTWQSGGLGYLVDDQGLVVGPNVGLLEGLVMIQDLDGGPLAAGTHVEPTVLRTVHELVTLLPEATVFQYSEAMGISLTGEEGLEIYFGDACDLPAKVASMKTMLREITNAGDTAQFIDVRFVDSPYYR